MKNIFVNKICTITTLGINRNYREENGDKFIETIHNYFMGKVISVDEKGLLLENVFSPKKTKSWFNLDNIVSISEEESLNPNDPMDAKIIQQVKEEMNGKVKKTVVENNKLNIDDIENVF